MAIEPFDHTKYVQDALKDIAPDFVGAVADAKRQKADHVSLSFRPFMWEPDLFFQAVSYASMEGVSVLVITEAQFKPAKK